MTPYDGAMAGVILAGMVWGAFRGITWQVASIASLILGYTAAHSLSAQIAPRFPGEPIVARSLAMLTVYLATSGGIFFVAWLIRATLRKMKFEAFDRHLGMLLGGLEGVCLGLVATLFVVSLAPQMRGPIFSSPSGKAVAWLMVNVGPVLPEEARNVLSPFLGTVEPKAAAVPVGNPMASSPAPKPMVEVLKNAKAAPSRVPATFDGSAQKTSGSLGDLFKEEEARLSNAIFEGAARGVKQAVGGITGGPVERR